MASFVNAGSTPQLGKLAHIPRMLSELHLSSCQLAPVLPRVCTLVLLPVGFLSGKSSVSDSVTRFEASHEYNIVSREPAMEHTYYSTLKRAKQDLLLPTFEYTQIRTGRVT